MLTPLSAITLPSGRGRSAQLLCITNNLIYNPPKINWQINGVPVVNETGLTVYNSVPVGLNFLRVADVSINGNQSTTFTCVASNLEGEETANVSVSAVGKHNVLCWHFVVYTEFHYDSSCTCTCLSVLFSSF